MVQSCGHCSQRPSTRYSGQIYPVLNPSKKQLPPVCQCMTWTAHRENALGKPTKLQERKYSMAKPNKFNVDMDDLAPPRATAYEQSAAYERNETRGPGRPIGKRSNPAFKQYTVLLRVDSHSRAIEKLRKITARPDFGEYVENLILKDLR